MSSLAIITARGGSKRIPRKNIRNFCGKPIIAYSITAAIKSGVFDEVMVSTDDKEIADIAARYGASVPFMRSDETAGDYATTDEVIREVLDMYKEKGREFDSFCCLYPTAPFITPDILKEAMEMLKDHESVTPVAAFSYPPQRGFVISEDRLVRKHPEFATTRSQDLEKLYHDSGQFYACRTDAFYRDNTTDVDDMVPLVLPEDMVQDIDTPKDWAMAETKFGKLRDRQDCENNKEGNRAVFDDSTLKTPYYRIDEALLDKDIDMLKAALNENWKNHICSFSVKTNSLPWLLEHFRTKGFYAEVVSKDEYDISQRLGYTPDKVIYNSPVKERESFEEVLVAGGLVNMDSAYEPVWLAEIASANPDRIFKVGLRVNCDLSKLLPDEVLADEEGSRFGYCYENGTLGKVIDTVRGIKNVRITGLHLHSSTKSRSVNAFRALASIAVKLSAEFSLDLEYVDMGGGYFGGMKDKPDFRDYIPAIAEELRKGFDPKKTTLIVEPGVSLVSSSMSFVTSVIDVKDVRGHRYAIIDGSRVNLNPQVSRRWYLHRLDYLGENADSRNIMESQMICGSTCMEYDRLFAAENEKELLPGDRVVFLNAGGYTMCLTPLFIHYFPGVYVKKTDNTLFTARSPWTNDEYMALSHIEEI